MASLTSKALQKAFLTLRVFLSSTGLQKVFLTLRVSLILKVYQKMFLTLMELKMECLSLTECLRSTGCLRSMEFEIMKFLMKHFQCRLK